MVKLELHEIISTQKAETQGGKKKKFSLKLSTRIRFVLNVTSAFISAFVAFV